MLAERAELVGEAVVIRRDAPRLSIRPEVLAAIEGEAADAAARARLGPVVEQRAVRLRGVLDDRDVPVLRDLAQRLEVDGPAVEVHRDDRLGPRRDRIRDGGGVHEHGPLVDVHEDRPRARVEDRLHRREERVRYGYDLVPGRHAAGADREL